MIYLLHVATGLNVKYECLDWVGPCAILSLYDAWLWTDYGKGESGCTSYSCDRQSRRDGTL